MVAPVTLCGTHDISLAFPRTCGRITHGIPQSLRTTGSGIAKIIVSVTLIEPRTFLIILYMWEFHYTVLQRYHIVIQTGIEGVWITPIHIRLSVIIGINRRINVIPVALIPYQRFSYRVLERSIGRIRLQHSDAMSVKWCIEIVFPVTLNSLYSPGSILPAPPGDILQRCHSTVLRPVNHVGG